MMFFCAIFYGKHVKWCALMSMTNLSNYSAFSALPVGLAAWNKGQNSYPDLCLEDCIAYIAYLPSCSISGVAVPSPIIITISKPGLIYNPCQINACHIALSMAEMMEMHSVICPLSIQGLARPLLIFCWVIIHLAYDVRYEGVERGGRLMLFVLLASSIRLSKGSPACSGRFYGHSDLLY